MRRPVSRKRLATRKGSVAPEPTKLVLSPVREARIVARSAGMNGFVTGMINADCDGSFAGSVPHSNRAEWARLVRVPLRHSMPVLTGVAARPVWLLYSV